MRAMQMESCNSPALANLFTADNKENEMTNINTGIDIEEIEQQAFERGVQTGKTQGILILDNYKSELLEALRIYSRRYHLCDEGMSEFCEEMGLEWSRNYKGVINIVVEGVEVQATDEDNATELLLKKRDDIIYILNDNGYVVDRYHSEVQDVEEV